MKKLSVTALLLCAMLLFAACAGSKSDTPAAFPEGAAFDMADAAPMAEEAYSVSQTNASAAEAQAPQTAAGEFDVRKIVYNADMSITADDPAAALQSLSDKAAALGGYVSDSYTRNDDLGALHCSATLKVPAGRLDALVTAAQAVGKVDRYQLSSDDISLSYYDIQARLNSAKAEEATLTAILADCKTVEEVLAVRESLSQVRADIESYQGQINLWDNLVAYATLSLSVERTPRTPVEGEDELISIWKASDVWKRMARGFANSARFTVNAVGAVGIFLAIAAIPAGILFLCIGLPIILWRKKKKRLAAEKNAALTQTENPAGQEPVETNEQKNE